jgi:hypothetical protein
LKRFISSRIDWIDKRDHCGRRLPSLIQRFRNGLVDLSAGMKLAVKMQRQGNEALNKEEALWNYRLVQGPE